MEEKEKQELSYEQLQSINKQLKNQLEICYRQLTELNAVNYFKRLDYLFKTMENSINFPMDFVDKCREEIIAMMTPSEASEEKEQE